MRRAMAKPCIGSLLSVLRTSISSVPWSMSTLVIWRYPPNESLTDKSSRGVWLHSLRMSRGKKTGSHFNANNGHLKRNYMRHRGYYRRNGFIRMSKASLPAGSMDSNDQSHLAPQPCLWRCLQFPPSVHPLRFLRAERSGDGQRGGLRFFGVGREEQGNSEQRPEFAERKQERPGVLFA